MASIIMNVRKSSRSLAVLLALTALTLQGIAQERDRSKIPDQYKWNLADIYPNEAAWRAAKDKLQAEPGNQAGLAGEHDERGHQREGAQLVAMGREE